MYFIQAFGKMVLQQLRVLGVAGFLLLKTMARPPEIKKLPVLLVQQLFASGVLSLLIIVVSGLFIGMVVALQGYNTLSKFGAAQQLGPLVALSVTRELGPVVAAILFAGRAASALTAEIGLMKATEQLASMEMMAVDPISRVLAPRFWGAFFSVPILTIIFNAVAIVGAYLVGVRWLGLDSGAFWSNMQSSVDFHLDVINGLIKSIFFGVVVSWVAIFQGNQCPPTAAGIASATTKTVVYSALLVLGLDFILTAMMIGDW